MEEDDSAEVVEEGDTAAVEVAEGSAEEMEEAEVVSEDEMAVVVLPEEKVVGSGIMMVSRPDRSAATGKAVDIHPDRSAAIGKEEVVASHLDSAAAAVVGAIGRDSDLDRSAVIEEDSLVDRRQAGKAEKEEADLVELGEVVAVGERAAEPLGWIEDVHNQSSPG